MRRMGGTKLLLVLLALAALGAVWCFRALTRSPAAAKGREPAPRSGHAQRVDEAIGEARRAR